jgi:hypothetical protein
MASVSVFVCPGGNQTTATILVPSGRYPVCTGGQGGWQQVELAEPFDPAMLSQSELAGAFSAGFIVMATGLVIVWSAKQVMRAIRSAL